MVGSTENMTGAKAYRPGDVYQVATKAKTVEVINTDAEGRMVLADVLTWAARNAQTRLHDRPRNAYRRLYGRAGARTELRSTPMMTSSPSSLPAMPPTPRVSRFWRMPLDGDLRSTLKSPVADLKHVGGRYGGSITAALFLKEFVGDVHLDAPRHRRPGLPRPPPPPHAQGRHGLRRGDRRQIPREPSLLK